MPMYNPTKPYKKKILKIIKNTWNTPYVKVSRGIYPIIEKKFLFPEVQHTDGIGTKGLYHWRERTFRNAVLDVLAMNLNDLAMVGAVPYALQNHIILPKDDHPAILEIIRAIAQECKKRNIAMTGGETSIHSSTQGMDISITVSGFIKTKRKNKCKIGDVLVGIKSSGIHSNGMTKVREVFGKQYRDDFVRPTVIYIDTVQRLLSEYQISGMMHITGGAFTKIKDILDKADARIVCSKKLLPQRIFTEIYEKGILNKTMYSTFNCGIGFVLSMPKSQAILMLRKLKNADIIGEVVRGDKHVRIQSAFDNKILVL
jgi:phosphoribosylformylglycinamidine cyclo-ligase